MIFFLLRDKRMSSRLKDSIRTKLIAEFIRTGVQPEGYLITENDGSKYKVRKIKSQQELLRSKKERLMKQLENVEYELKSIDKDKAIENINDESEHHQ